MSQLLSNDICVTSVYKTDKYGKYSRALSHIRLSHSETVDVFEITLINERFRALESIKNDLISLKKTIIVFLNSYIHSNDLIQSFHKFEFS